MKYKEKYTLVQHSGYAYGGKPGFQHAVELITLVSKTEENLVKRVGGVLLEDYEQADALEEKVNYPENNDSIYPAARGTFSDKTIKDLPIYIPASEVDLLK